MMEVRSISIYIDESKGLEYINSAADVGIGHFGTEGEMHTSLFYDLQL